LFENQKLVRDLFYNYDGQYIDLQGLNYKYNVCDIEHEQDLYDPESIEFYQSILPEYFLNKNDYNKMINEKNKKVLKKKIDIKNFVYGKLIKKNRKNRKNNKERNAKNSRKYSSS